MNRFLASCWLVFALCATSTSCTKKTKEDKMPSEQAAQPSSATSVVATSSEPAPEPEATPAAEVSPAPETTSTPEASVEKATPSASARKSSSPSTSTSRRRRSSSESESAANRESADSAVTSPVVSARAVEETPKRAEPAVVPSKPAPKAEPVAAAEQWIVDPLLPEKCENGILYKFEKNSRTGVGRKTQVGTCPAESSKPSYLNKSVQQVKDEGVIKKGETGTRNNDN